MRKKLLSLLTVLCMVLGMLPTTAFAAAAEAYEKNEVARVITADTEINEDVDGLVLVDAPCKVTVKDAKLSVGIVVSPDAAGAEVTLTGTTEAAEVVVLAASSVKVEETATAASVTVDAAEAAVEVAGTASEITVTENAEKTAVTVAATAKVETVTVSAPAAAVKVAGEVAAVTVAETAKGAAVAVAETAKVTGAVTVAAPEAKTEVAGEVAAVTVAETAKGAAVTVAETATVKTYEVAAPDVKTEVAGTVENVKVAETATGNEISVTADANVGAVDNQAKDLAVSGDGADKIPANNTGDEEKKDEDKKDEEKKDPSEDLELPVVVPQPTTKKVKICWSNQSDGQQGPQNEALSGTHTLNNVTIPTDNQKTVTVNATVQPGSSYARGSVDIHASNLKQHNNGGNPQMKGYWIGFGVELPAGEYTETVNAEANTAPYKYYLIEKGASEWDTSGAYKRVYKVTESEDVTFFNTLYFDVTPTPVESALLEEDADITPEGEQNEAQVPETQEPAANGGEGQDAELQAGDSAPTPVKKEYIVVVTTGGNAGEGVTSSSTAGSHTETIAGTPGLTLAEGEEAVYVFDVTITADTTTPAAQSGGGSGSGGGGN